MSCILPSSMIAPVVEYFAMLGFVSSKRLKDNVTVELVFFSSSSLALTLKKTSSVGVFSPILSAWRLSMRMDTVTPETEYLGEMGDSSGLLYHLVFNLLNIVLLFCA